MQLLQSFFGGGSARVCRDGRSLLSLGGSRSDLPLKSQVEVVGNRSYAEVLVGPRKFLSSSSSSGGKFGNFIVPTPKGLMVSGQVAYGGSKIPDPLLMKSA